MSKEKFVSSKLKADTYTRLLAISKKEEKSTSELIDEMIDSRLSKELQNDFNEDVEKQIYKLRKNVLEDIEINRSLYKILKGF